MIPGEKRGNKKFKKLEKTLFKNLHKGYLKWTC